MRVKKLLIAFLAVSILSIITVSGYVAAQYRGSNLYFSGELVSGGETLSDGRWVSRINSTSRPYYPLSSGVRESGVYPLPGYEGIDPYGSAGYVMPNKQSSGGYALGVSSGGGAVGTMALGGMSEAEKVSGTPENNRTRKLKLYNLLESKNKNGSQWEKMGSAHVVYQMLGRTAPWGGSNFTVSDSDWTVFRSRLVENPEIWMVYVPGQSVPHNTAGVQIGAGVAPQIDVIDDNNPSTAAVWAFRRGASPSASTNVYMLEIICANPIGNLDGLPPYNPQQYSLQPSITSPADGTSIRRGEAATATGRVINNGPDNAGSKTWYVTRLIYNVGNNPSKGSRTSNGNGGVCAEFAGNNGCATEERSQTFNNGQTRTGGAPAYNVPTNAAPGTQICYVASVRNPTHNTNPVWRHSAMQCFRVAPPSYNLDPSVTSSRGEDPVVEPGNNVQITPRVENKGEDESGNTIWELTRMIYDPSTTVTGNDKRLRNSGNEPCTEFRLSGNPNPTECENIFRLNNETWDGGETRNGAVTSYSVPDNLEAGTKICFATSVSRPTYNATPVWRHSAWWCMTIGKKPKVQVWGGDVRAGGSINTSVTEIPSRGSYGSWVEYAALSRGPNSGFGSGAGLINGDRANDQGLWSNFTFANIDGNRGSCTAMYGCFESLPLVSALAGQFGQGSNPRALTGANLNSQYNSAATSYTAGDITLSASTISNGRSMVIIASGTVTISGDISYSDGSYSNLRDIPQVVIIAPTINIQNSVGRVDAWLLAGVLNTCSDSTGALTISRCNRPLEINGPVVANQIHLRRTAGSGAQADQRGEPAERFNLRADAFLWAYGYRSDASRAQTVYVKEMAPRF